MAIPVLSTQDMNGAINSLGASEFSGGIKPTVWLPLPVTSHVADVLSILMPPLPVSASAACCLHVTL